MCHVVFSFRTCDQIKDVFFFTREKADVVIDNPESSIQFLFNLHHVDVVGNDRRSSISTQSRAELLHNEQQPHNDMLTAPQNCHLQNEPRARALSCSNEKGVNGRYYRTTTYDTSWKEEQMGPALFCVVPMYKCCLMMDAHLAASIAESVKGSQVFRRRFWRFLQKGFGFFCCLEEYEHWDLLKQEQSWTYLTVKCMVDIVCVWPRQKIDYAWGERMAALVGKRMLVEEALAYLSTLGGGYSSLGDYFHEFAVKAGQISWHQLKLAMEIGDPITAAKCRVFWAQSLLQRGYLRHSKAVVWEQYKLATSFKVPDEKLVNMCVSVWNRLKFLYKERRLQRKSRPAKVRVCNGGVPSALVELSKKDDSIPAVNNPSAPLVGC